MCGVGIETVLVLQLEAVVGWVTLDINMSFRGQRADVKENVTYPWVSRQAPLALFYVGRHGGRAQSRRLGTNGIVLHNLHLYHSRVKQWTRWD